MQERNGISGMVCICARCVGLRCVVGMLSAAGSRVAHCYSSRLAFAASLPFLRWLACSFTRSFVRFHFKTILPWPLCTCDHSAESVYVLCDYVRDSVYTLVHGSYYIFVRRKSGGLVRRRVVAILSSSHFHRAIRQLSRVISNGHERAPCTYFF